MIEMNVDISEEEDVGYAYCHSFWCSMYESFIIINFINIYILLFHTEKILFNIEQVG